MLKHKHTDFTQHFYPYKLKLFGKFMSGTFYECRKKNRERERDRNLYKYKGIVLHILCCYFQPFNYFCYTIVLLYIEMQIGFFSSLLPLPLYACRMKHFFQFYFEFKCRTFSVIFVSKCKSFFFLSFFCQ
jgi:hypothetical protein